MPFGINPFDHFQYLAESYAKYLTSAKEPAAAKPSAIEPTLAEPAVTAEPVVACKITTCNQVPAAYDVYFPSDEALAAVYESGKDAKGCKDLSDIPSLLKCRSFFSTTFVKYLSIHAESRRRLDIVRQLFDSTCLDELLSREPNACDYAWQMDSLVKQFRAAETAVGRVSPFVDLLTAVDKTDAAAQEVEKQLQIFIKPINEENGNARELLNKEERNIVDLKKKIIILEKVLKKKSSDEGSRQLEDLNAELEQAQMARQSFIDTIDGLEGAIKTYNDEHDKLIDAGVQPEFVLKNGDDTLIKWEKIVAEAEKALKASAKNERNSTSADNNRSRQKEDNDDFWTTPLR